MARSLSTLHFTLLSFLLISCSGLQNSKQEEKANIYFRQGTHSLMKRQFEDALINLNKAKDFSPKRSDIHNNLGMAYYFKGKKKTAVRLIRKSIKLDKKNTEAKSNLASIYLEANKLKSAKKLYLNILKDLTYKKQFQTYYNLGVLELKKKNIAKGNDYFKKSIKQNPYSCNAHFQLGNHYLKNNQLTEAKKHFNQGSDGSCTNMEANNYYLAITNMKLGHYSRATKEFNMFKKRFPNSKYSSLVDRKLASLTNQVQGDSFENVIYSQDGDLIEFK